MICKCKQKFCGTCGLCSKCRRCKHWDENVAAEAKETQVKADERKRRSTRTEDEGQDKKRQRMEEEAILDRVIDEKMGDRERLLVQVTHAALTAQTLRNTRRHRYSFWYSCREAADLHL